MTEQQQYSIGDNQSWILKHVRNSLICLPRGHICASCITGIFFTFWATREALIYLHQFIGLDALNSAPQLIIFLISCSSVCFLCYKYKKKRRAFLLTKVQKPYTQWYSVLKCEVDYLSTFLSHFCQKIFTWTNMIHFKWLCLASDGYFFLYFFFFGQESISSSWGYSYTLYFILFEYCYDFLLFPVSSPQLLTDC